MSRNLLRLSLSVCAVLSATGCKDLSECVVDSDCQDRAASTGQTLFCSDNMCVVGSPRASLCKEIYPASSTANATVVGVLVNTVTGSDQLRLQSVKLAVDEMNTGLSAAGKPPLALHVCETSATNADMLKSYQVLVNDRHAHAHLCLGRHRNIHDLPHCYAVNRFIFPIGYVPAFVWNGILRPSQRR